MPNETLLLHSVTDDINANGNNNNPLSLLHPLSSSLHSSSRSRDHGHGLIQILYRSGGVRDLSCVLPLICPDDLHPDPRQPAHTPQTLRCHCWHHSVSHLIIIVLSSTYHSSSHTHITPGRSLDVIAPDTVCIYPHNTTLHTERLSSQVVAAGPASSARTGTICNHPYQRYNSLLDCSRLRAFL